MIIPSKEETLTNNILVQGSRVIRVLEAGATTIDDIRTKYPTTRFTSAPTLERLLDVLTYLYVIGLVVIDGHYVSLTRAKV